MNRFESQIRKPVRRQRAESYLLVTLLSFAASVTLTRLFLEITGYPQLGGGGLHIAHILWGGLFLFIASLMPLILANRWVYTTSALLAGIGVGLFIDEVGKFITQNNDYFYPGAAPIIYAFFLLTVLLYTQVRRSLSRDPRAELYRALEGLLDVLDHDLTDEERTDLEARLAYVAKQAEHPDLARLASELLSFVQYEELYLVKPQPSYWQKLVNRFHTWEEQHLDQTKMRLGLIIGIVLVGAISFVNLIQFAIVNFNPDPLELALADLLETGDLSSQSSLYWFVARLVLDGSIGLVLLLSGVMFWMRRERQGVSLAYFGLLISLTVINMLVFFYEQFSFIAIASLQFLVLLGLIYYRQRFLPNAPPKEKQS